MPRLSCANVIRLESREKSTLSDVEHRQPEHDEQRRDAEVEPGRRVDRAERAGGENDDEPEHAVDDRHRARRRSRRAGTRAGVCPACAPAPMIARLIGIIGSTHGVRFSARPPRNTIARIASGPRPSKSPLRFVPDSASRMNCQEIRRVPVAAFGGEDLRTRSSMREHVASAGGWCRWRCEPPTTPATSGPPAASAAAAARARTRSGRRRLACCCACAPAFGTTRIVHDTSASSAGKQILSSHAW